MAGYIPSQIFRHAAMPMVTTINPATEEPQLEKPPTPQNYVRFFTVRFENPNLGFSVMENDNGVGLKVCSVSERLKNVGLKENFAIVELAGWDMRSATLADWRNAIRRCRLPLRVRFKSLRLTVEEEEKYRLDLNEAGRSTKRTSLPKQEHQQSPKCLYCGVSWFLILFAVSVYVALMGVPSTILPSKLEDKWNVFAWISNMQSRSSKPSLLEPMHKTFFVDLADIYLGNKVTFEPGKIQKVCPYCSGTGAHHGLEENMYLCDSCGGSGVVLEKRELFGGLHTTSEAVCPKCDGRGQTISQKCSHCHGKGYIIKDDKLTVRLKKGIAEGTKVTLAGQGQEVLGYPRGDLVIEIFSKPHKVFKRDGLDLLMQLKISLSEAFKGFEKTIVHLDGRKIPISSTTVVNEKSIFRLKNEGLRTEKTAGTLHINFRIIFPRNIGIKEMRKMREKLNVNAGRPPIHNYKEDKSEL